jgi:hypothetical protein
MDIVFWIILIVLIVGVVWWLLNRGNTSGAGDSTPVRRDGALAGGSAAASAEAAGTAGLPGAAGFGAAEPAPPTTAEEAPGRATTAEPEETGVGVGTGATAGSAGEPDAVVVAADEPPYAEEAPAPAETPAPAPSAAEPPAPEMPSAEPLSREEPGGSAEPLTRQADDEWETQWSEPSGSPQATASHRPAGEASAAIPLPEEPPSQNTGYVHHAEYTAPHSPTMPGAETAAAEAAETEAAEAEAGDAARDGTQPGSAPTEESAQAAEPAISADFEAVTEPAGHLAADQPYGAGSASPGQDGSGPADFAVKGDAATMVYYEEGHADYEQAKADVWFESPAHAEAAGFRAPRRTRS